MVYHIRDTATIKDTIMNPRNRVGSFGKTVANRLVMNIAVLGLERFVSRPFDQLEILL